jgi:transcriptional regulator with XRE-family HTH domain
MPQVATTGEKVKRLRRGLAMTQAELAEKAGVAQSTITMLERGQISEPHPRTMKGLANALAVSPADLLDDPEEKDS